VPALLSIVSYVLFNYLDTVLSKERKQIALTEKAIMESHHKTRHRDYIFNILSGIGKEFGCM
jgi:hypothetical protein